MEAANLPCRMARPAGARLARRGGLPPPRCRYPGAPEARSLTLIAPEASALAARLLPALGAA